MLLEEVEACRPCRPMWDERSGDSEGGRPLDLGGGVENVW